MDVGADLGERIEGVRKTIAQAAARSGRRPEEITLVAVSKTVGSDQVLAAARRGVTHFGENRVQEAEDKLAALANHPDLVGLPRLQWHLIGHLQTNKARAAVKLFDMIESVDSRHLALDLDRLGRERRAVIPVLLEVNVGHETTKFGFTPEELPELFPEIRRLANLDVRGLMTVAPAVPSPELARPFFQELRALRDRLRAGLTGLPLAHLSMGMTGDYPVAIEEGATIVRVGRAIFGDRPV